MNERLKFEGRLGTKQRELKALELRIRGLRKSIRDNLDPFEQIEDLKADIAASQALELADLCIQYKALQEEIKAIEKALGR